MRFIAFTASYGLAAYCQCAIQRILGDGNLAITKEVASEAVYSAEAEQTLATQDI